MTGKIKKTFCWVLGVAVIGFSMPSYVKAQHIVTESEAGKLTLASLTAAPVIRHSHALRHSYKKSRYAKYRTVSYQTVSNKKYASLLHKVSYRQKAGNAVRIKNAVYNVSAHKKTRTRRHRS